jgi:hypothetical protein
VAYVKRIDTYRGCAICRRTLLMGERAIRYSPGGDDWVDVCALCTDVAAEHGWIKEGAPTTPLVGLRRRRLWPSLARQATPSPERRGTAEEPVTIVEPLMRRLSSDEQTLLDSAELFNESAFSRTVAGIAKSLGEPRASLVSLSGTNPEVVITVAWDISWYQYRVVLGSGQPVRLAERGYELDELEERFTDWNARFDDELRLVPLSEGVLSPEASE